MSISIVIVNWNSGKLLGGCLDSILSQTIPPRKTIIVDNASTVQREYIPRSSGTLEVIRLSNNIGFAAANNKALARCKTEFIALLNPDAFPESKWIENLLQATVKYPDVASFGSKQILFENPEILDGVGDIYHASGLVWRERHGMRSSPQDNISRDIFSPCAAAALYRRQPLVDVGGFDEDFFCYIEDVDVGFRLRLAGHSAMYVPSAVVHHIGSATTGGKDSDISTYYCHRNLIWTYVKNMPGLLFWALLPFHIFINLMAIVTFSFRGRQRVIIRAKIDAIKELKSMWLKRKHIQRRRFSSIGKIGRKFDWRLIPPKLG